MYWIYKHLESLASGNGWLFRSTNICSLQNTVIQWKYPEFAFLNILCFVWSTSHWERIIDSKWAPSRNKTRGKSRWYIYLYSRSRNCYCGSNLVHKAMYSVQLSVVPIYICLKEALKASNSVLSLCSWAEERFLFSRMFKYWMLIMKFQIDYLVSSRSMKKDNFKFFWQNSDISGEMIFHFRSGQWR